MSRFNFLNPQINSYLLLVFSMTTLLFDVNFYNQILFLLVLGFSIFQNFYQYKFKNFFSYIVGLLAIYIQFKLNDQTLSKEFFLNTVLLLIFIKFSEAKNKNDYYFFNFTIIFLSVTSLIYGQDFLSSANSILLMLLSILHLYSINQQRVIQLNLKYIGKYLLIGIIALSIIGITYFIFPRYEIKIKLFETAKNNLGIPDQIELGSFSQISNNNDKVFIYDTLEDKADKLIYFRVKVFDLLNLERSWVPAPNEVFNNNYKDSFSIIKKLSSESVNSKLIVYPNDKTWLPILNNFYFDNKLVKNNFLNGTANTSEKIDKKTPYFIKPTNFQINLNDDLQDFYRKLPNTFSEKLFNWSLNIKNSSSSDEEYLNKLMEHFSNGEYFYSLSPNIDNSNNYEKFFFDTKTGYCEYYAGMFAILARLQNIPTRLVSGYMGGTYNELGNFYTFKQSDAHTWVESYIEEKGWIRYDPTQVIPQINIISFNNVSSNSSQSQNLVKENDFFKSNMIKLYYDYFDYIWTNKFQEYNQQSRNELIKNTFENLKFNSFYLFIFICTLLLIKPIQILLNKKLFYSTLFKKIRNKKKIYNKTLTHQELFKLLSDEDKIKLNEVFNVYEKVNFAKNYKISYKTFFKENYKIIKFYLNIV